MDRRRRAARADTGRPRTPLRRRPENADERILAPDGRRLPQARRAPGDWDRRQAFDATTKILAATPDLIGIYCNNDTMAFGAVDAVEAAGAAGRIQVFGSDGTAAAYASIAAGDLAGTVDIFPMMIGEIGLDVAARLSAGQSVPRVVETPQVLVTRDNIGRYGAGEDARRKALIEDNR